MMLHLPVAWRALKKAKLPREDSFHVSRFHAGIVVTLNVFGIIFSLAMLVLADLSMRSARTTALPDQNRPAAGWKFTPWAILHGMPPAMLYTLLASLGISAFAGAVVCALTFQIISGGGPGDRVGLTAQKRTAGWILLCAGAVIGLSIGTAAFLLF